MIAEPYICIKGPRSGEIQWQPQGKETYEYAGCIWRMFNDFEREKLKELAAKGIMAGFKDGCYVISVHKAGRLRYFYDSEEEIGYSSEDFRDDSESSRLLKRAEFLKTVCEKEGVEWLPREQCQCKDSDYRNGCDRFRTIVVNNIGGPSIPVQIDPAMANTEMRMRNEQTGEEVRLGNVKIEPDHCEQCCDGSCGCPCHKEQSECRGALWSGDTEALAEVGPKSITIEFSTK